MGYLYTGEKGTPLKEIIEKLGNKNYDFIECRCKWVNEYGEKQDELFGACSYKDGILTPLDGDSYSLDDLYIEWEEHTQDECVCLTVWEYGYLSDEWKVD